MLSHKTLLDKRKRKGAFSRIRGFLKGALRGARAGTRPQIIGLWVKARLGAAGACAGLAGVMWGGLGESADHANAAQLLPGMFAHCHFHLTCSFFSGSCR